MPTITTREHLEEAPALEAPGAGDTTVTRAVTLARCLRCSFEWMPRVASPSHCARCKTSLWNVPRAQQLPGKPAPTRKGKPRGRALVAGDPRHSSNQKKEEAEQATGAKNNHANNQT